MVWIRTWSLISASTYSPVADAAALRKQVRTVSIWEQQSQHSNWFCRMSIWKKSCFADQADAIVAAGSGAAAEPEPWSWPSNGPPCPGCVGMARWSAGTMLKGTFKEDWIQAKIILVLPKQRTSDLHRGGSMPWLYWQGTLITQWGPCQKEYLNTWILPK